MKRRDLNVMQGRFAPCHCKLHPVFTQRQHPAPRLSDQIRHVTVGAEECVNRHPAEKVGAVREIQLRGVVRRDDATFLIKKQRRDRQGVP